jgi:hypothetical protein
MATTTLTLTLDGEVSLADFDVATHHLRLLLFALAEYRAPHVNLKWTVEGLQAGSASTTIRLDAPDNVAVAAFEADYLSVGRSLGTGSPMAFPLKVIRAARGIAKVIGPHVTQVRFETRESEVIVTSVDGRSRQQRTQRSYGSVEGRIQTLTSRGSVRFTLYDTMNDRAVSCYLQEGRTDIMRGAWDRRAYVTGWITRDIDTGRPLAIRQIEDVEVIEEVAPGAYLAAMGILNTTGRSALPEIFIRRMRDGE